MLAHLQAIQTRGDPTTRRQWKLRLVKGLYRGHWTKDDVRELFRLIDWIMTLPEDLDDLFRAEMFQFEEEQKMPFITSIERLALKKGREEGLLEGIELVLETKFGPAGRKLLREVRALGAVPELRRFARFLKEAKSLDEVRARLSK